MPFIRENNEFMDGLRKSNQRRIPPHFVSKTVHKPQDIGSSPLSEIFPKETSSAFHKQPSKKSPWRKFFFTFFILFFFILLSVTIFFLYKSISVGRTMKLDNKNNVSFLTELKQIASTILTHNTTLLRGEEEGRINILLLGRAGEHYSGKNLTDTIMVMSIDTLSKKVSLLSLPRDLYVAIPETSLYTKINSLYQYGLGNERGIETLRATVENITGQKIQYSFILDFSGFEKVVNTIGGIPVDVVRDFYDPRYPGKNYSYETFEIKKGWQTLDGSTALKYVRERHNDPEGDFGRAKRQQQVIQAIKDKTLSLGTIFNFFALRDLLDTLGESVETDMSLSDMEAFLGLIKTLDTKNITTVVVDAWEKESMLRVSHIQVGPTAMFILVPRIGNWSEVRDISENIFHLDVIKARQQSIEEEQSSVSLIALSKDSRIAEKMKRLIEEMGFQKVSISTPDILNDRPKESTIVDATSLTKPYSLDELLQKFPLKKENSLSPLSPTNTSDFIITIGDDILETLSFDEANISKIPDDTVFSEVLPPQEKAKKKQ